MRKPLLSLLTLIVFGISSNAQKISIIPKVGMTISKMHLSDDLASGVDLKNIAGIVLGGAVNVGIKEDFFSVQAELLYIQKGIKSHGNSFGATSDVNQKLNYLEIPLLAKISFGSENIKGYVNAGPSVGFALGGNYKIKGSGLGGNFKTDGKIIFGDKPSNYTGDDTYLNNDEATRTDIGLQFGGGVGYSLGPGMILFDIRYGLGLINFRKQPDNNPDLDNTSKHRVLALTFGYAFPITK